jgi:hypothetical protein
VHTALPDPENSDAGWFAFKECMAKPGIKEAWFEVKPDEIVTGFLLVKVNLFSFFHLPLYIRVALSGKKFLFNS